MRKGWGQKQRSWLVLFWVILELQSAPALGQSIPGGFPIGGILDSALSFLGSNTAPILIATGLIFNHRPMEPATPLGIQMGVDIGLEVDFVQIPSSLSESLKNAGLGNVSLPPALPSGKLINFHKGLGPDFDIGGAIFLYQGYLVGGLDLKWVLSNPEEGLTWAARLGYNSTYIPVGSTSIDVPVPMVGNVSVPININFHVVTWTPTVLVSRKLDFAEPYLGLGYAYVNGTVNLINNSSTEITNAKSSSAQGGSFLSFIGLSLRVPHLGLRVTLEGAYSGAGYNSVGAKVGFSF